jgi:hypothetical protein
MVTGHGKTRSYLHRFKILQKADSPCGNGDKTSDRLLYQCAILNKQTEIFKRNVLTLSLLMSYICGAPSKPRNFNVVYIWTNVWQRWKPSLYICCTIFQHWINAESYPVAQLCVNTLLATKVTLTVFGRSCDRPPWHGFFLVSPCV